MIIEHKVLKEQATWLSEKNIPRKGSGKCKGSMGRVCEGIQGIANIKTIEKPIEKHR